MSHTGLETQIPQPASLCEFRRRVKQTVGRDKEEKGTPWEVIVTFQVGKIRKKR